MKTSPSQKIKIGVFTLVALFIMLAAVFLIGKNKNLFGGTYIVKGVFKDVAGLTVGNNVRFLGINVGTVESINIRNDTSAVVSMRLKDKVKQFIKKNAIASISSDGLMGDKIIVLSSSDPNAPIAGDNSMIATQEPASFDAIVKKLSNVAANAEVLTDALAGVANQIKSGKGSLGTLLYNDQLANNLKGTVSNIRQGTEKFDENMEAVKHNFLLRGYFKRKEKKAKEDSAKAAQAKAAAAPQNGRKKASFILQ